MTPALWIGAAGMLLIAGALAGRPVRARLRLAAAALGGLLLLPGLFSLSLRQSLAGYVPLPHEQAVASIRFTEEGPRQFAASLQLPGAGATQLRIHGDEWQIDARILTWKAWANWLGMRPLYRFERLSGRYTDVRDEREQPRSVHALYEPASHRWQPWLRHGARIPGGDAYYGTAAFLPMADDAAYVISVSASGLVVRPDNPAASRAIETWDAPMP